MAAGLSYYKISMPLLTPFTTSFGTQTERIGYIFRLASGSVTAYSECVTGEEPHYSYEDNETAMHVIRNFFSPMIADLPQPRVFMERASVIKGHNMAKAALEMLLWDYHSRAEGIPLARRLGDSKGHADVGISIGMDSVQDMVRRIGSAVEKGYRRIKVKVEKGKEFGILSAVRDSFPDIKLSADANTDYTLKDAELLKRLDRFNLVYMEQPLGHDDLLDHSRLARQMATPICLDESITDSAKAEQAFDMGACSVINIKPGRVGGLTESLKVASVCAERGGHCWVGGMLETGVGRAFNISLASQGNVDYPGDTSPNDRYFSRDIVDNPFHMVDGRIRPNDGPGTGIVVNGAYLSSVSLEQGSLLKP